MKKQVIIKFEVDGFHNYPNAPEEVKFLSYPHRHTFVVTCSYKVKELNREKEIFICRDEIRNFLYNKYGNPCEFKNMSCEMIATDIMLEFISDGMISCEVWEEDTGGAKIEI